MLRRPVRRQIDVHRHVGGHGVDRRPLTLADPEGQILVDLSHLYRWPKGEPSQFNDPGAILRV